MTHIDQFIRTPPKNTQTIKILVLSLGNSYIAKMCEPYCGRASDDAIHICEQIAEAIPSPKSAIYNYDRGLERIDDFAERGVRVVKGDTAKQKQKVFSPQSGERSRRTSRSRIHIERIMRENRCFEGFNSKISLKEVDLAALECECARFLVNLTPENHDWSERSVNADDLRSEELFKPQIRGAEDYCDFI